MIRKRVISSVKYGWISSGTQTRPIPQQRKVNDDSHIISSRYAGAGEQINYVPMNSNLNRGAWKKMENIWDKALQAGKKVEVDIKPIYSGDSKRPDKFKVIYKIDGKEFMKKLKNEAGGK